MATKMQEAHDALLPISVQLARLRYRTPDRADALLKRAGLWPVARHECKHPDGAYPNALLDTIECPHCGASITHQRMLEVIRAALDEPTCTCFVTPEHMWFTHYGAVEPGSMWEWNPDCEIHHG